MSACTSRVSPPSRAIAPTPRFPYDCAMTILNTPHPQFDLLLERVIPITPEQAFRAWTQPELLKPWFCPRPWMTTEAEIDPRPGGRFRTVMEGPNGERVDNTGCILEVVEGRKFAWTGALKEGYRPMSTTGPDAGVPFLFSAVITMDPHAGGTLYRALAIHPDEVSCRKHEQMGFHAGWGAALDQMVAMVQGAG
jgi:uncharacterized protein YndB with AHSA1/START domain